MEPLQKAEKQVRSRITILSGLANIPLGLLCLCLVSTNVLSLGSALVIYVVASVAGVVLVGIIIAKTVTEPLQVLGNAILHISPTETPAVAVNTDSLRIGRGYVTDLIYQLHQITEVQSNKELADHKHEATQASNILARLPLPLFVFNKQQIITFASESALSYVGQESSAVFGKPVFEVADLEFSSDFTLESWIIDCQKNKVTDTAYWRRVRFSPKDNPDTSRQCDIAGYYNRDNPSGIEFIVTVFDRTEEYVQDDQSLSFMALAVHELRTPLTLMRGLVETLEDELDGKLDNELQAYMKSLRGSAQQLAAFVNSILNVAKIEENQLRLKLSEESWIDIVEHAAQDMEFKAKPLGIDISYSLPSSVPMVAVDRLAAYEVIYNLLDNAIKYSTKGTRVTVAVKLTKDNLVETTVSDKGLGIPTNVLPSLFEKFHRNHRTQNQVGGTGLGLYLSKAIINAHGGNIWVKSKEGEGTTVGFTLKPYSMLAEELKTGNNKDDMVRTAHGWIKNHSLYRR